MMAPYNDLPHLLIIRPHFNYLPDSGAQGGKFYRSYGMNKDD